MKLTQDSELLTAAEERRLARAIEAGVLAEHLLATGERPLSASVPELLSLMREGRRSWQQFLLSNLRLVWMLAGREARRTGLGVDDLFQEGCVALAGALQRFDPDRGRFSTYAVTRIRQHLVEVGAARFGELALPTSRAVRLRRVLGLQARLGQENGREVGAGEVAEQLQRPADWTRTLLGHQAPVLIDTNDPAWQLADPRSGDPIGQLGSMQVEQLLAAVSPEQRTILRLRYGLDGEEPASLVTVANRLRMSPSSVRRLEQRGLTTLRSVVEGAESTGGSAVVG